jgi:hypothetical protein
MNRLRAFAMKHNTALQILSAVSFWVLFLLLQYYQGYHDGILEKEHSRIDTVYVISIEPEPVIDLRGGDQVNISWPVSERKLPEPAPIDSTGDSIKFFFDHSRIPE